MKKIWLAVLSIIITAVICIWFFVFYKPTHFKRDVTDEKGVAVVAKDIVKEYQNSEANANTKYLNKTISVTGEVGDIKDDQDGNVTVTLKSDDPMSNVFCTLKSATNKPSIGSTVTIKGICTGFLSDVVLNEAIIVK